MINITIKFLAGIFIILIYASQSKAQDSLYLVNSLVGDTVRVLRYAKAAGDINGDGYADLAVTFSDYGDNPSEHTHIYYGNPTFDLTPDFTFEDRRILCPGDINNDGYSDLISMKTDFETIKHSTFYLHWGGEEIDSAGQLIYEQQYLDEVFSLETADPIGDVNNDGYNDFLIASEYNWSDGIGRVYVYFGGDTLNTTPLAVLTADVLNEDYFFGQSVTGIGDQNGDGFDDFIIGTPNASINDSTSGKVYLYYGGQEISSPADSILTFHDSQFGFNVKNIGDINGDENNDFAITSYDSCVIYFNIDSTMTTRFYGSGHGIGGNGDINNDGISDFILGYRKGEDKDYPGAECFTGENTFNLIPDLYADEEQIYSSYAKYTDFIGDFNDDSYDNIFVHAASFRDDGKKVGKLYIYSFQNINSLNDAKPQIKNNFILKQNYPNPFNATTVIEYHTSKITNVELKIFNLLGKKLFHEIQQEQNPGNHNFVLNAEDWASGIYFYQVKTNTFFQTKKMLLIE